MTNSRVYNETRKFSLKYKQALKAIEHCTCVWVIPGKTVRDCSYKEAIELRKLQEKEYEALANSELPGIVFKPPIGAQAAYVNKRRLAFQANKFATEAVQ